MASALKQKASPGVEQAEDVFLSALQALPDAVFLLEQDSGKIAFANLAGQTLTGKGGKGLVGKTVAEIFGTDSTLAGLIAQARVAGQPMTLHDAEMAEQGLQSMTAVPDAAPRHDMLVVRFEALALRGSTWVSRIRYGLRPAQHLARVLAHEIKNPLSGIRGAAQLLQKSVHDADDCELAALIEHESGRILRLVEKVGALDEDKRVENFAPVNIHAVLEQVVRAAQSGFASEAVFALRYDPSLPDISGDHDRLMQVFLNLVKNAAEAEGEAPRVITLRTSYAPAPLWHPETHEKLPLCVSVEDNGAGISPDVLGQIFDPYYTTKKDGDGIGLAVVSQIVDSHGGIVEAASAPGRTEFKVYFPLPPRQETP